MKKRKNITNRKGNLDSQGFTLAELLIVVALIAILVAVSVPIFTGQIGKAKKAVCDHERAVMKHGCAVMTMSDETNWSGMSYNDIRAKLFLNNLVEEAEFKCPSEGTLEAKVSEDGSSVTITCSKHSGDGNGGDSGKHYDTKTEEIMAGLEEIYASFFSDYTGTNKDNSTLIKAFLNKTNYALQTAYPKDVLTDEKQTAWLEMIKKYQESKGKTINEDSMKKSISDYANLTQLVVPYALPDGSIVKYYTGEGNATRFGEGQPNHANTSLVNIGGTWYVYIDEKVISKVGKPFIADLNGCKNEEEAVNKIESLGWVALE